MQPGRCLAVLLLAAVQLAALALANPTPVLAWGRLSPANAKRVTLGFVYEFLDAAELSFASGAYESDPARAGHFAELKSQMRSAEASAVRYDSALLAESLEHGATYTSPKHVAEALRGARPGAKILVRLAGTVKDEASLYNAAVIAEACTLARQVSGGDYVCFVTGSNLDSRVNSARRRAGTSNVLLTTIAVRMRPETFMGMFLVLFFALLLVLFFCCLDGIEIQTFFAPKYPPKGKVFE